LSLFSLRCANLYHLDRIVQLLYLFFGGRSSLSVVLESKSGRGLPLVFRLNEHRGVNRLIILFSSPYRSMTLVHGPASGVPAVICLHPTPKAFFAEVPRRRRLRSSVSFPLNAIYDFLTRSTQRPPGSYPSSARVFRFFLQCSFLTRPTSLAPLSYRIC